MNNDLAWLAGIIEGEGCISTHFTHKIRGGERREYPYPQLRIAMADEDVVRRCAEIAAIFGGGVYAEAARPGRKPMFKFTITGEPCRVLLHELLPLFGKRRTAKTLEVLA